MSNEPHFISRDGSIQEGPFTLEQVRAMHRAGQLPPQTLAWREGLPDWVPLRDLPGLGTQPAAPAPSTPIPPQPVTPQVPAEPVQAPAQPQFAPPPAAPAPQYQPGNPFAAPSMQPGPIGVPQRESADGLSITSLILGISGIVMVMCFAPLGLICGVAGLICGLLSRNKTGVRIAGITTSAIALALGVIMTIVFIIAMAGSSGRSNWP